MTSTFPRSLLKVVSALYQPQGRFVWHFVQGKLAGDSVFAHLLQQPWLTEGCQVLDIGCGRGLLAASLCPDHGAEWPQTWPQQVQGVKVRGIDLNKRDVQCARQALAAYTSRAVFIQGDMRTTDFGQADVVVILDVLHYVDYSAQTRILRRVHAALPEGGRLLLRVADKAAGWPYRASVWVDTLVAMARGHTRLKLSCRTLSEWRHILAELGFDATPQPMHHGTPFANILLSAVKKSMKERYVA